MTSAPTVSSASSSNDVASTPSIPATDASATSASSSSNLFFYNESTVACGCSRDSRGPPTIAQPLSIKNFTQIAHNPFVSLSDAVQSFLEGGLDTTWVKIHSL
jgi:hypothetical protein